MTSETQIRYGSRVPRQGRTRFSESYQASSLDGGDNEGGYQEPCGFEGYESRVSSCESAFPTTLNSSLTTHSGIAHDAVVSDSRGAIQPGSFMTSRMNALSAAVGSVSVRCFSYCSGVSFSPVTEYVSPTNSPMLRWNLRSGAVSRGLSAGMSLLIESSRPRTSWR